jgi:hypothetical protein
MFFESIMTLVPAVTALGATAAVAYIGYVAASCSIARLQGNECSSDC